VKLEAQQNLTNWATSIKFLPFITPEQQCEYYARTLGPHFKDISLVYICSKLEQLSPSEIKEYFSKKFIKYSKPYLNPNPIHIIGNEEHRRALNELYELLKDF
jgi:hypothetical protein